MQYLTHGQIRVDPELQTRAGISSEVVADFSEPLRADGTFELPPLIVFYDGQHYWLADGFHRLAAYALAYRRNVPVEIREGTREDALRFALSANAANDRNAQRRTNADKRRAVTLALQHPEWSKQSNYEIAELCKVHQSFVASVRNEAASIDSREMPDAPAPSERVVNRGGKTFTMKTENIGKKRTKTPEASAEASQAQPEPVEQEEEKLAKRQRPSPWSAAWDAVQTALTELAQAAGILAQAPKKKRDRADLRAKAQQLRDLADELDKTADEMPSDSPGA